MLKTKIKAGSITNLTDARYFAAWGVDWLGFDLVKGSENNLADQDVLTIKEWVDGVSFIGEVGLLDDLSVTEQIKTLGLEGIQFGQFSEVAAIRSLPESMMRIQERVVEYVSQLKSLADWIVARQDWVDAFLLDFSKNGICWPDLDDAHRFDLKELCSRFPILLAMDVEPSQMTEIIELLNPLGFELKGGEEEKIGFKSFDNIDEIFEEIELLI